MFNRITLLALLSMVILSMAACAAEAPPAVEETEPVAAAPAPEPEGPYYELTTDDITTHPDWTSRNITILGAKLGDTTNNVLKNFGTMDNTRTLAEDYLTIYQNTGLFVYTYKFTGKIRKMEAYTTFSSKVKDAKLKRLLTSGDLALMREIFGMEEGEEQNLDDPTSPGTVYIYDTKGIRFIKYGGGVNAIQFGEIKRPTT